MNRKIGKTGKFGAHLFPISPAFLFQICRPRNALSLRACSGIVNGSARIEAGIVSMPISEIRVVEEL